MTDAAPDGARSRFARFKEDFGLYRDPRAVRLFFLGFSAGLPLLLVFGTLSAWLRQAELDRATIGYLSAVSSAYAFKFLWAPAVDRMPIPGLVRLLGQRRSWMLATQICIAAGLLGMALTDPATATTQMALLAALVAFSSATQDVAIDAYRIESAPVDLQAALSAMYTLGYRIAMLLAGGYGALRLAEAQSWPFAYAIMAALMTVGMVTVLVSPEPVRDLAHDPSAPGRGGRLSRLVAWFRNAVIAPLVEFFRRAGWRAAVLILAFVLCYRLSDLVLGVMANVFYIDLGFTLTEIANVTKVYGLLAVLIGAFVGGALVRRHGVLKILLVGAVMVAATNLTFVWLARGGPEVALLTVVITADNLSQGIATTAFIAYLSGLTNSTYTATQYALLSSAMLLLGIAFKSQSGAVVDAIGYEWFFVYCAALGLPAITIVLWLIVKGDPLSRRPKTETGPCAAATTPF